MKPPQSFRHLHYHHNINVWEKRKKKREREKSPEECRLLTFCFVLSSITMEHFFFPSTLVEGIRKKEHRHAYLISFSTGSHKRNCQDTFRNVSIKSKSSRNGGFMSDSKLLADLKGGAVCLCKAADVLFHSLVAAQRERDRSTRASLSTRAAYRKTRRVGKGCEHLKKKNTKNCAASWSLICSVKRRRERSKRGSLR